MAPRKAITFEEKLKIINDIDSGVKQVDIAKIYRIPQSTISSFLRNRKSIEHLVKSGQISVKRKRVKDVLNKSIDSATIEWFNEMRSKNVRLNGPLICSTAKKFANKLGIEKFKASNGWLRSFKNRYGIAFKPIRLNGDERSEPMANDELQNPNDLSGLETMFHPNDIYSAIETGLFYQSLPERTFAYKNEKCCGGKKANERLTVLLCVNATGTDKVKPLVIGKSANPSCFQNTKSLSVEYFANECAWMTEEIFNEWLHNLDITMARRNRQIALIIDKCTPHNNPPPMENVHIYYFLPNSKAVSQPLDLGVVKCLKAYYRRNQIEKIIFKLQNNVNEPFSISVKQASEMVGNSWNLVKENTIKSCWRKAGFNFFSNNNNTGCDKGFTTQSVLEDLEEDKCIKSIENCLNLYQSETGQRTLISAMDYIKVDKELLVFGGNTKEDLIAQMIANTTVKSENSEVNNSPQITNLTPVEAVFLIEKLYNYISTLSNIPNRYFFLLDSLTDICMEASSDTKPRPSLISEFFF